MYDTTNLWLSTDKVNGLDITRTLHYLSNVIEHSRDDGQTYYSGVLGQNYKIICSSLGVSIKGSLAKFYLSDNFKTLTRSDTEKAIEKLADELNLPINKAKVSRLDFAANIMMDCKPEKYYDYLGDCRYYNRLVQPKSIYYTNGLRQKIFYNKIAEANSKKMIIPDVWKGQNVLRYELRFISRLPKEFNKAEVTASHLYDEKFYMDVFDRWHDEYETINKKQNINMNFDNISSPKDFERQLMLKAIDDIGGPERAMQIIEELRDRKVFSKPEYYSRLKKGIKSLCNSPRHTTKSDLISELDKKIAECKSYYR